MKTPHGHHPAKWHTEDITDCSRDNAMTEYACRPCPVPPFLKNAVHLPQSAPCVGALLVHRHAMRHLLPRGDRRAKDIPAQAAGRTDSGRNERHTLHVPWNACLKHAA